MHIEDVCTIGVNAAYHFIDGNGRVTGGMRICELHEKKVVNVRDGCIIGCVVDVEFDWPRGCICAIIVPGPPRLCGIFCRECEYVIPYRCVTSIGGDVVLVDVDIEEISIKR